MRRQNTEPIEAVIQRYIKTIGAEPKLLEIRVKNAWETTMGQSVVMQTQTIFMKGKTLFLKISNPVLKAELMMLKQHIIIRLNEEAGPDSVFEIRFI